MLIISLLLSLWARVPWMLVPVVSFLSLSSLGQIILGCMSSNIPGLYPQDANNNPLPQLWQTEMSLESALCPLGTESPIAETH